MEVTFDGLEFDSNDRAAWKTFLGTRAGLRLFPKALESVPSLLGSGDTNSILVRSGEVRGFNLVLQTLLALAEPPPPAVMPEVKNYPDPRDDAAWNDGQKLNDQ
jgi:hypothetical protein